MGCLSHPPQASPVTVSGPLPVSRFGVVSACWSVENLLAATRPTSASVDTPPATDSPAALLLPVLRRRAESSPRTAPRCRPARCRPRHNLSLAVASAAPLPSPRDIHSFPPA